ncbi:phosphoenolpyruvate-dependent sugar phosphotransferase system, EIIA 1 [Paenibacillus sp. cl141a]|uniref:spore coat protein n=1 Tax=Paenibacillus sp. cl141a TaxID=1761877 RepID=UPI0008D4ACE0|nr:spore coat protein [Paenibacillus sp. cl141a]SEK84020.1 phosphoenolpyruvate-dependent sugar phosphotransferase system, EIIA 1 [Paenibacillus sp. cl141a]
MATPNGSSFLPEEDLLSPILGELKRAVREYTTAATEATCPDVRQMFTHLTTDTLSLQGEFFNMMKQQNMYTAGTHALKYDVDKQHKQAQQSVQKTRETINQKTSSMGAYAHNPNVEPHATNVSPASYM